MKKLAISLLIALFSLTTFSACDSLSSFFNSSPMQDVSSSVEESDSEEESSSPETSTSPETGNPPSGEGGGESGGSSGQETVSGMLSFNISNLNIEGAQYSTELTMTSIGGMGVGYLQLGDYGNGGFQMRTGNVVSSAIWNVSEFPAPITKIVLTHSSQKSAFDGNAYSLSLGTTADLLGKTTTVASSFTDNEWTINVDGEYTYFQLTHANTYTQYWESIDVYYSGEPTTDGDSNAGGDSEDNDPDQGGNENEGTDANGVHSVDFTKATNVKDVTDLGDYLDGCPTVGSPNILVIPVEFSDALATSKGYTLDKLNLAFNGGTGTTDYYSVKEYYKISSYGQLDLTFTVLDAWFKPANNSSYYKNINSGLGDQMVMDEALAYLDRQGWDLSQFDSDDNGTIDAVVLITTLEIDYDYDFNWAYRYWNMYVDQDDYYYEYDGVSANDYIWASYQFLFEDETGYDDRNALNTYTFIHEFGHILGADDYYDTSGKTNGPMDGYDIMDSGLGDHNAHTKAHYGWLTTSRLVVAKESVTLTLEKFSKNGDSIIIANNWDDDLGVYQEYFLVVYYTNDGLNAGDAGYFSREGILVYHVNATLTKDGNYYFVSNNNTDASDEYGSADDLIEYVKNGSRYVYGVGASLSANTSNDNGDRIAYTFTVDSISNGTATLTFTPNA